MGLYDTLAWERDSYALSTCLSIAHSQRAVPSLSLPVSVTIADGTKVGVAFPLPSLTTVVVSLPMVSSSLLILSAGAPLDLKVGDLGTRGSASIAVLIMAKLTRS